MKRVEWIDNLRGLGIVFVIIGRMSISYGFLSKIVAEVYNGTLSSLVNLLLLVLITTVIHRYVPILNGKSRIFIRF